MLCVCYKIVKSENALKIRFEKLHKPSLKPALWKDCFQMLRTLDKGWLRRCKTLIDSAQRLQIAFCGGEKKQIWSIAFCGEGEKADLTKGFDQPSVLPPHNMSVMTISRYRCENCNNLMWYNMMVKEGDDDDKCGGQRWSVGWVLWLMWQNFQIWKCFEDPCWKTAQEDD